MSGEFTQQVDEWREATRQSAKGATSRLITIDVDKNGEFFKKREDTPQDQYFLDWVYRNWYHTNILNIHPFAESVDVIVKVFLPVESYRNNQWHRMVYVRIRKIWNHGGKKHERLEWQTMSNKPCKLIDPRVLDALVD